MMSAFGGMLMTITGAPKNWNGQVTGLHGQLTGHAHRSPLFPIVEQPVDPSFPLHKRLAHINSVLKIIWPLVSERHSHGQATEIDGELTVPLAARLVLV
jgi:hypothetical protein